MHAYKGKMSASVWGDRRKWSWQAARKAVAGETKPTSACYWPSGPQNYENWGDFQWFIIFACFNISSVIKSHDITLVLQEFFCLLQETEMGESWVKMELMVLRTTVGYIWKSAGSCQRVGATASVSYQSWKLEHVSVVFSSDFPHL